MQLRALRDHIIIEKPPKTEQTRNGIYIASKNPPLLKGKIISTGKGKFDERGKWHPMQLSKGQTILFSDGTGQSLEYEGKVYVFFKPEDILAVIKEDA